MSQQCARALAFTSSVVPVLLLWSMQCGYVFPHRRQTGRPSRAVCDASSVSDPAPIPARLGSAGSLFRLLSSSAVPHPLLRRPGQSRGSRAGEARIWAAVGWSIRRERWRSRTLTPPSPPPPARTGNAPLPSPASPIPTGDRFTGACGVNTVGI
jgi:hypothetical protein